MLEEALSLCIKAHHSILPLAVFLLMLLIFIKVLSLLMTIIMFFYKHNRTLFYYSYALGDRT